MHTRHDTTHALDLASLTTIHDEFEARYWSRTLGLSRSQVRDLFGQIQSLQELSPDNGEDAEPLSIASLLHRPDDAPDDARRGH